MSAPASYYALGAASTLCLLIVGLYARLTRPRWRRGLGLFLLVWGVENLLTYAAWASTHRAVAAPFFWASAALGPLSALLLFDAAREAAPSRRLQAWARRAHGAWVLLILVGVGVAVAAPRLLLDATADQDGGNAGWGPASALLVNGPEFVGVGLGLLLWGLGLRSRGAAGAERLLFAGVLLPFLHNRAYSLALFLVWSPGDVPNVLATGLGMLLALASGLWVARPWSSDRAAGLSAGILGALVVAVMGPVLTRGDQATVVSNAAWVVGAPGLARILGCLLVAAAVWRASDGSVWRRGPARTVASAAWVASWAFAAYALVVRPVAPDSGAATFSFAVVGLGAAGILVAALAHLALDAGRRTRVPTPSPSTPAQSIRGMSEPPARPGVAASEEAA